MNKSEDLVVLSEGSEEGAVQACCKGTTNAKVA